MTDSAQNPRRIKSFVLRAGRMTEAQQRGFDEGWTLWGVEYRPELLDFDELFGGTGERVLEIGFGMGQSLLDMAAARPTAQYLGVEVHRPGVGRLLHGVQERGLSNIRAICHDAVEVLENCIAPGSLQRIQIYFPDPWHKKRHNKRRLIQPVFTELLVSRLAPSGVLHLATDWEPYAEHMLEVLNANPSLENCSPDGDYVPRPKERPLTKFELRGQRLGHGVWDLLYRRGSDTTP
ncbi:tRNA (guanosine(46)-N7)-methyltransferase TrmB [Congregibacter brevis]|uniref:tRNA (guanine-N(7)-)-methyltransferase n=1 Tax=Congregibacter brevis TaxID=3081201 RepID=A0ABZ0ID76_9GAMM|nr:tRNA (guanosine(46)-N7)-methyltransferase TrmB [Congregibacter sp. IMCC45268]